MRFYVDESKAESYLLVAVYGRRTDFRAAAKELGDLVLPGQRSLHIKDERDSRKREIADAVRRLGDQGIHATVYDAGRDGSEKERRARCLAALVNSIVSDSDVEIVLDLDETLLRWDRQKLVEISRVTAGSGSRITYSHAQRHEDPLLALPDAVAWCWARGGEWRRRIRPIVREIRRV